MRLSVFAQSFLDSFGFANMIIPSRIPGAPKYLIAPDAEDASGGAEQPAVPGPSLHLGE
jgi:hypothetical protein